MAQIICRREGRQGFHVGDVVDIPDNVTSIDSTYFARVETGATAPVAAKPQDDDAAEVAKLEQELATERARIAAETSNAGKNGGK